jgi:hypothetical protein
VLNADKRIKILNTTNTFCLDTTVAAGGKNIPTDVMNSDRINKTFSAKNYVLPKILQGNIGLMRTDYFDYFYYLMNFLEQYYLRFIRALQTEL